jgi:hypothetical protein
VKLSDLLEAKLKGAIDPFKFFSDLETDVFYTLFVDEPYSLSHGFNPETLRVRDIIPTQADVDGKHDVSDDPIIVVRRAGKNYVIDGHHRLYKALKNKAETIACEVLELPLEHVDDIRWFEQKLQLRLKQDDGIVRIN